MKNQKTGRRTAGSRKIMAISCWLIVWQLAAIWIHNDIMLAGPFETARAFGALVQTTSFRASILHSYGRIVGGFFVGTLLGVILAIVSFLCETARSMIIPFVHLCKTVPVACFVVILLIRAGAQGTALIVSAIVAVPVIYTAMYSGLNSADREELEIADMFTMTQADRVKHIFMPALYPFVLGALKLASGVSFKAGIAAEVIAQTAMSLGNDLYKAKVLLQTDVLFAITVTIVLLSFATEKAVVFLFRKWGKINEYE